VQRVEGSWYMEVVVVEADDSRGGSGRCRRKCACRKRLLKSSNEGEKAAVVCDGLLSDARRNKHNIT